MHGLSKNIDLNPFLGAELEQIGIGKYQTQLRFSDDVTISIEGLVSIDDKRRVPVFSVSARLTEYIGKSIRSCAPLNLGDLAVTFDGGGTLIVHDSNDSTESYTLESRAGLVVV